MCGKYSTRGRVERLIQHEVKPSAVFASRYPRVLYFHTHKHSIGGALSDIILYFLVVWLGAISSSAQTAVIFGDQDISKCLFLIIE